MSNEWVMVPREPTRDMIDAAQNAPGNASYLYHARVYRAMLDAAPAAPQQAEPVAWPAGHRWARNMAALESQSESDPTAPIIAPQRAEPVAWRDHVEQRLHNWRQRTMNRSGDRLALDDMMSKESIDDLIDYVCDEWSDPVAPQQAEPVGWFIEHPAGCWEQASSEYRHDGDVHPLYLHPPAAEVQRLRDALGAILKRTLDASSYRSGQDVHDIARRALEGK